MRKLILITSVIAISGAACGGRIDGVGSTAGVTDPGSPGADNSSAVAQPGDAGAPSSGTGDSFVPKSHTTWYDLTGSYIIGQDIGYDSSYGETVYSWVDDGELNYGYVARGSSTHLHSISRFSFYSPKPVSTIRAIAIAKNTQKVYTWYTFYNSTYHCYMLGRMIGTSTNLGAYDSNPGNLEFVWMDDGGSTACTEYTVYPPGNLVEAGISNNGSVYFYWRDSFGYFYRISGSSLYPTNEDYVKNYLTGYSIVGIAFNAAGTEYTWYGNSNPGGYLNTGNNSLYLW